jgi:hypothetical protein
MQLREQPQSSIGCKQPLLLMASPCILVPHSSQLPQPCPAGDLLAAAAAAGQHAVSSPAKGTARLHITAKDAYLHTS